MRQILIPAAAAYHRDCRFLKGGRRLGGILRKLVAQFPELEASSSASFNARIGMMFALRVYGVASFGASKHGAV